MTKYKQITFSDRETIESGIAHGDSFKKIAKTLSKSTSTITNEILKNRTHIESMHQYSNDCVHSGECSKTHLCGNTNCPFPCKWCRKRDEIGTCATRCHDYCSTKCSFLLLPPYVCNNCQQKDRCIKEKYFYNAKDAEAECMRRRARSRRGPHVSEEKLAKIDNMLYSLIVNKGQSITHIIANHAEELGVCERTIRNYIDRCYTKTRRIDLRKAVSMTPRKKNDPNKDERRKDRSYKIGRSYADFNDYVLSHTDELVCEMDTVIGKQKEPKRILTMFFRRNSILLIFLLPDGKAASVYNVFDWLDHKLGVNTFRRIFPVILTDNGSEFQQVERLEINPDGEYRTNVYFCDPMCSHQKGAIERVHELIRYVLPKGSSFESLEQQDFTLIMNHINSYKRKSLDGKCPYDMVDNNDEDMLNLMKLLRMHRIPADEVNLKPNLIRKRE